MELTFSNSMKKTNKIPSCFLLSQFFTLFLVILLSTSLPMLLCFFTTFFLLLFFPPILDHGYDDDDDDSPSSVSKLGSLLSVVESLVRKISCFVTYLDVFRETEFEKVLEGNCSESGFSGGQEEGRESKAHVGPMENKPNGSFDQNPFGEKGDDDGKVEAARQIAEESMICEFLEENFSESGCSGNCGRESRNHVGPQEKVPSFSFDENPFEKNKGKLEGEENKLRVKECNEVLEENFSDSDCSVDLIEDPTVNLEEKPAGEEGDDDVDKVEKNTAKNDMFCQKRDKEVKPLDTDSNKGQESKDKMTLRSGSKVMCTDTIIDATEEDDEEEYFRTPERYSYWDYKRSYGSMRKEKEWRRTLAFKLYEERNNVKEDGRSNGKSNETMDMLWETYDDVDHDKVKESTKSEAKDEDEDEEEKEEKEKGMESKYCCLQALKLSSGKVNLGMRKPSLVKISKALKSIGFFHHVSKHGRKKIH